MKNLLLTTMLSLLCLIGLQAQITTGLQAEYLLDANVNDTQNSNNATIQGTTLYGEDRFGLNARCYAFDGNTRLALPQDLTDGEERSISLWFLTGAPGGLIGHSGTTGYAPILYIGSDGKLKGKFWDGSQGAVSNSSKILTDSLWHHVAITSNANSQSVYLDNQLVGTINNAIDTGGFDNTYIGYVLATNWPASSGVSYLSGRIDDVRIYDIEISASVVDELYTTPTWTPPTYGWELDTLYIDADATGNNDGSSWANAYTNARTAFINTTENCEIWIAEGTYVRNSTNRNVTFGWSKDSVLVYGGFAGGETNRDQRDWNANPTIFSGDIGISGDNSDNAYTVFSGPVGQHTYSLIDGIKITGGNSDENSYPSVNTVGGGMTLDTEVDFIELKNIEIYDNKARAGGAISVYGFSGDDMKLNFENIIAYNNTAVSAAFAHIRSASGTAFDFTMTNCLVYENEATGANATGAAIDFGTVMILGSTSGTSNGVNAVITNCTFADNEYPSTGHSSKGMIRLFGGGTSVNNLDFTNNICFGNNIIDLTNKNSANATDAFNTVNLNNNILDSGIDFTATSENNSLTSDPLFNAYYSLQQSSPAIDAGTSSGVMLPMFDLAGNARVSGSAIDLGCFEFNCTVPTVSLNLANGNLTASGASTYAWYLDGVDLILNNTTIYTPTQDGEYYVVGTSVDGCSDTSNVINFCGSFTLEITENNGTFTATSGLNNYQWFLDGNAISGANSSTFSATSFGDYTVEAEQNGCTSTSNTINYSNVSINSISAFENVNIYPNPTSNFINISINEDLTSLEIMSITGQTLMNLDINQKQIDLSNLNTGIYFLEIANAEKKSIIKIIKK